MAYSDVRCLWLGTMWSRALLSTTRSASSASDKDVVDLSLTQDLQPAFAEALQRAHCQAVPSTECYILGAVAVRPRERFSYRNSGHLGAAIATQISHWTTLAGRPLDLFALIFEVVDAVMFAEPVCWNTISGRRGGCFVAPLESGQEERLRRALPADHSHLFRYPFSQVLRLPFPYVTLLLTKLWSHMVVPDLPCAWNADPYDVQKGRKFSSGLVGAGHKWQRCWPALSCFGKRPKLREAEQPAAAPRFVDMVHGEKDIWDLADCLASLGNGAAIEEGQWQDFLAGLRYQHAESVLLASRRHNYVARGEPSFAFRVGHLVEVMLCSMFLKSDHSLGQALMTAACLLLPKALAESWMEKLAQDPDLYLPSPAVLSQRRAALDMGFALFQQVQIRNALESGAFLYAMTDSSPQGGRDYEITVLDMILGSDARDIMFKVRAWRQSLGRS